MLLLSSVRFIRCLCWFGCACVIVCDCLCLCYLGWCVGFVADVVYNVVDVAASSVVDDDVCPRISCC